MTWRQLFTEALGKPPPEEGPWTQLFWHTHADTYERPNHVGPRIHTVPTPLVEDIVDYVGRPPIESIPCSARCILEPEHPGMAFEVHRSERFTSPGGVDYEILLSDVPLVLDEIKSHQPIRVVTLRSGVQVYRRILGQSNGLLILPVAEVEPLIAWLTSLDAEGHDVRKQGFDRLEGHPHVQVYNPYKAPEIS
jgi:hypothetical protein